MLKNIFNSSSGIGPEVESFRIVLTEIEIFRGRVEAFHFIFSTEPVSCIEPNIHMTFKIFQGWNNKPIIQCERDLEIVGFELIGNGIAHFVKISFLNVLKVDTNTQV